MAKQVFVTRIGLNEQQVAKIMAGYGQVRDVDVVQTLAQESVSKLADGGMILPGAVVVRIEKVLGKITDPVEIAEAVEDGAGMEGDNVVVSMTMDPIYLIALQEKADVCGMTVDTLASELQSQILHMGMLIDMPVEAIPVYLTPEQLGVIGSTLGLKDRPVFGEDIARYLGWNHPAKDVVKDELVEV